MAKNAPHPIELHCYIDNPHFYLNENGSHVSVTNEWPGDIEAVAISGIKAEYVMFAWDRCGTEEKSLPDGLASIVGRFGCINDTYH